MTTVSTVGSYELLGVVATTASATVWKARDTALDRTVALKQIRTDNPAAERLRTEATLLAAVRHPHIVRVYDLLDHDGSLWLSEQWIDGAPLSLVLAKSSALRPVDALALTRNALQGLGHAHDKGIVHGDVTPTNILIDASGAAMLVDFGLAAPAGTAGAGGTPGYLSPEAAAGEPVTPRSDVYSAAAVLARLLLGHNPFSGSIAEVVAAQRRGPPRLRGVDEPVAAVLRCALSVDPAARPADANELLEQLDEAAKKSYGTKWIAGSSLGALGSTAATVAAGLQLGSVVAGGSIAAPALGSLGGLAAKITGKNLLAATGATAAAAAAIIGYTAFSGDSPEPDTTAAQQPTGPGSGDQAAAQPQHPSAALSGNYDVVATVVTSNNIYGSGIGRQMRWTLKASPICPGPNLPCSVGITTSDNGANAAARFANNEWTATRTFTSNCVDMDTGIPNGSTNSSTQTFTMRLTDAGVDGTIVRTGTAPCASFEEWTIAGTRTP